MGSLIIIPAVTAKHLARNLNEMLGYAIGVAILATLVGTLWPTVRRDRPVR